MDSLEVIRKNNKVASVFKRRKLAKALNNPGGHAKDAEKGRVTGRTYPKTPKPYETEELKDGQPRSLFDDPEMDGTDFAHPAWWRGNDNGSVCTALRLEESVDGLDDGHGVVGNEIIERVRRKILALRKKVDAGRKPQ